MDRICVKPELFVWARERAGLDRYALAASFPKLPKWESGELQPTLRQLEAFASAVHVPFGYLFLPDPPDEPLPVADFRSIAGRETARASPNLLDTLYLCQQRQEWYRDYARLAGLPALSFVGSAGIEDNPVDVAEEMRSTLAISVEERAEIPTWTAALRELVANAEDAGVLVMSSSIVGNNNRRKLQVEEFRGFALADEYAPLVFLNAADSKAALMFTLAHELAHIWLGESGVSDVTAGQVPRQRTERWCNEVAAELLVPMEELRTQFRGGEPLQESIQRLARVFKVSSLVALRRLFDGRYIDETMLWDAYRGELARVRELDRHVTRGGDFYRTLATRAGRKFACALLASTLEGQTLFRDALRLLGFRKMGALYNAARELGVTG